MENKNIILNELTPISPLIAGLAKENLGVVPYNYFENFTPNILQKIHQQDVAEELKNVSPVVFNIQKKEVLAVPNNYFSTLPNTVLNTIKRPQGKVVAIHKKRATILLKYAVAAAFTGAVALLAIKYLAPTNKAASLNYAKIMHTNVDGELGNVADEDIINYLTKEGVDVDATVTLTKMQDKIDGDAANADAGEIDQMLNQFEENKSVN